ncbi:MAG: carbamate kinase [Deltaproteobacteria bacterium]|nr:carbamate kinase [Deltaproteobacteria bacterium]
MKKIVVAAIGGNSLIRNPQNTSVEDQYQSLMETCRHLADIVKQNYRLVICHGNGPQVGFILRRSAIAYEHAKMHQVPLSSCVADTQGAIGFQIQTALENQLNLKGEALKTATVVTRVLVDKKDKKILNPSKPIGSFFTPEMTEDLKKRYRDWIFAEDPSGRGFRRIVASPAPARIIEIDPIKNLIKNNYIVIACGGGGIPVIKKEDGCLKPIDAVLDKDLTSSMLAAEIKAELFIISTDISHVYINFRKKQEKPLEHVQLHQIKKYLKEGHFAAGSMMPKIEAAINFIENGGKKVIITSPENLSAGIKNGYGTIITP